MSDARILDRGYRPYEGPRSGVLGAVRSLALHSARQMLGLRRPLRWKLVPFGVIFFAFAPPIGFIAFVALFGSGVGEAIPSVPDSYGFILVSMALFVYLVAPQALCPDRRNRVLGLYLASPLTRGTYLIAKAIAVGGVLMIVTTLPPLLLTIAYSLLGVGPRGLVGFLALVLRVLASGLALSTIYGLFALAISSLTERVAFAAAGMALTSGLLLVASNILSGMGERDEWLLISLNVAPIELVFRIHGGMEENLPVSVLALVGANVAWAVGLGSVAWFRYRFLRVTR